MAEEVILVDKHDNELGFMEKLLAHQTASLHRAFSVFLFDSNGKMLLQKRALSKYHSPGLWTNTCCSHPRPGENVTDAANRRLIEEMGIETKVEKAFKFIYKADLDQGLTEHELDYVFIGEYEGIIAPNSLEVSDYYYENVETIQQQMIAKPEHYTVWFKIAFPRVLEWYQVNVVN